MSLCEFGGEECTSRGLSFDLEGRDRARLAKFATLQLRAHTRDRQCLGRFGSEECPQSRFEASLSRPNSRQFRHQQRPSRAHSTSAEHRQYKRPNTTHRSIPDGSRPCPGVLRARMDPCKVSRSGSGRVAVDLTYLSCATCMSWFAEFDFIPSNHASRNGSNDSGNRVVCRGVPFGENLDSSAVGDAHTTSDSRALSTRAPRRASDRGRGKSHRASAWDARRPDHRDSWAQHPGNRMDS